MRIPRHVSRPVGRLLEVYSMNIVATAPKALVKSSHNIEMAAQVEEYNAVNIE